MSLCSFFPRVLFSLPRGPTKTEKTKFGGFHFFPFSFWKAGVVESTF